MEPGYALDYVYYFDGFNGRPIIYTRKIDKKPFLSFKEFPNSLNDPTGYFTLQLYGTGRALRGMVHVDGTEEGFFEYAVLQVMGDQFFLEWHANYNDGTIICDLTGLDTLEKDDWWSMGIPVPDFEKARTLDFKPVVKFEGDEAIVSLMVFTKWGGFKRITFTINKTYPHNVSEISESVLEYESSIRF
jgi:hypothetical protein